MSSDPQQCPWCAENNGTPVDKWDNDAYTLREWEEVAFLNRKTGMLQIEYDGRCEVCGFELNFKTEIPIPKNPALG